MNEYFKIVVAFIILLNVSCSNSDSKKEILEIKNGFYLKMFPGIEDFGFTNIENDNLIYIYNDKSNNKLMFVRINEFGEITVNKNITNSVNHNGNFSHLSLVYEWNNQVVLVYLREPQNDLISINFDYEGNLISQKTIEIKFFFNQMKLTRNGFYTYSNIFYDNIKGYSFNYTIYNFDGIITNSKNISLDIINASSTDLFIDNGFLYLTGNSELEIGFGYKKEFCYQFDFDGNKINSLVWDKNPINTKTIYNVLNNKIHRFNFSSNIYANHIELYNPKGELLKTLTLDYYPHNFIYNSKEQFIYLTYSNNSEKTLDFKILNSNLESLIYQKNFGTFSKIQNSGETFIFHIYESENFYNVFGQTTAIRNGDFNLPENTDSFDNFIARFKKN